jgi:spore germination cell wall hydrolase CwlJ-like protein
MPHARRLRLLLVAAGLPLLLAGCANHMAMSDRDCMTRVMYFESNRSSEEGMVAVGTTVMNRLATPGYPKTVCGVIGQRNQYADGVLDKPMNPREAAQISQVADHVLAGERHPQVGSAMFFHTAGLTFPYHNMHYVAVAGGNAFYEKTDVRSVMHTPSGFSEPMSTMLRTSVPLVRTARASVLFPSHPPTTLTALISRSLGLSKEPRG